MQAGDQLEVRHGVAGIHGVAGAHRHGERVHSGHLDELGGFRRIRPRSGSVHPVLSADFAELRLDPHLTLVAPLRDLRGGRHVGLVVERGGVEHDGADAQLHRLVHQLDAGGVIQVNRDRNRRGTGHRDGRRADRGRRTVVAHAVLADLQDHRPAGGLGPGHDRLGVLELDHVERTYSATGRGAGGEDLTGSR